MIVNIVSQFHHFYIRCLNYKVKYLLLTRTLEQETRFTLGGLVTYVLDRCLWRDKMVQSEWQMELFQGLLLSSMSPRSPYGGMPVSGTPWDLILVKLVPGVGSVRSFCPHFVSKDNSYHNCFCEFQVAVTSRFDPLMIGFLRKQHDLKIPKQVVISWFHWITVMGFII